MTINQVAQYFFIQGQLEGSNVREALQQRFIHFTKKMGKEKYEEASKEWEVVSVKK